jgi:hypothetical protein
MLKTFGYFISLFVFSAAVAKGQDTIQFPLKIRVGFDISGPAIYFADKQNKSLEGFMTLDRNEKMAYSVGGGYLDYSYSQYNYDYHVKGFFFRAGVDFNLLKPESSMGKYQAGVGLHYGISFFTPETPSFTQKNYWGDVSSSISGKNSVGHFLEAAPGVRAELFKNFSIGWTIRLRFLISGGGGKDLRPVYFPGFGDGGKNVSAGFNYYLTWNIPFKKIRVITKVPPPEEPEESGEETAPAQQPGNFR